MGMYKKIDNNTLQKLSGYTVIADGSCAEVRHGTITFNNPTWGISQTVTFETVMPDTDYEVILEHPVSGQNYGTDPVTSPSNISISNKTITGFTMTMYPIGSVISAVVNYTAIKLITMEGFTEIQNKITNPDSVPTENSNNLCISGGIYNAVVNRRSTFVGTLAQWDALTAAEKDEYEVAEINDGVSVSNTLLQQIYPVGSVYINTVDVNPSTIFGFGTWERIASNMALWGASGNGQVGTTKAAGLPNIYGQLGLNNVGVTVAPADPNDFINPNIPLHAIGIEGSNGYQYTSGTTATMYGGIVVDASKSNSIYGNSTTVQPPALVVNVWKRTA